MRHPELWAFLVVVAAIVLIVGVTVSARGDPYRDRITCDHFKAEGVDVTTESGLFIVRYPDGRTVGVSGTCVAESPASAPAEAAK